MKQQIKEKKQTTQINNKKLKYKKLFSDSPVPSLIFCFVKGYVSPSYRIHEIIIFLNHGNAGAECH